MDSQNLWLRRGPAGLQGPGLLSGHLGADRDPCASVRHVWKAGLIGKRSLRNVYRQCGWQVLDWRMSTAESLTSPSAYLTCRMESSLAVGVKARHVKLIFSTARPCTLCVCRAAYPDESDHRV